MGALSPFFIVAAFAVGVPIYLHLFHRHETRRLSFPALRYLERTEREHARQIRLRQLILLVMRVGVLILLVGAGARLFCAILSLERQVVPEVNLFRYALEAERGQCAV